MTGPKPSKKRKREALKKLEKKGQMRHRPNPERWFLSFVPFKASAGGAAPLIPLLTMDVGGGPKEVGIVNAVGSIASMIGGLFWGKLSDRLNRRKVFLIAGFLGTALSSMLFALAKSVSEVVAINAIYTFFIASTVPIPVLIITKMARLEDWDYLIGRFNEVGGWAWVAGMVIGLFLVNAVGIRGTFAVLGLICLLSVPMGMKTIREVPIHINRKVLGVYAGYVVEKFRFLPNMITHLPRLTLEGFGRLYTSTFIFWVGAMLYFTQFPVLLRARGFGSTELYIMSIANSSISAFMYTRVGKKLRASGGYSALRRGLFLRAVSFALLAGATETSSAFLPLAFISYFLAGYTWAFISISTTSIISHRAKAERRGALIGAYNMVSSVGAILGNFLSGFIVELFGFTVDLTAASALLVLAILPILREERATP